MAVHWRFPRLVDKCRARTRFERIIPLMIGYRIIRISLRSLEHIAEGRAHFDRAIALRSCRASSAGDPRWSRLWCVNLCYRSHALWLLGYPEVALADAEHALRMRVRSAKLPR